jgi:hypothetical protein
MPDDILSPHTPAVRDLANRVRVVVKRAVPTLAERALPGWKAIAFRDPHAGHVCALFPLEREVRLYIEYGARLTDPAQLLEGAATMTRGRYVRFTSARNLRARALTQLVRAAVLHRSL